MSASTDKTVAYTVPRTVRALVGLQDDAGDEVLTRRRLPGVRTLHHLGQPRVSANRLGTCPEEDAVLDEVDQTL
jgi:hypothetical protein